MKKNVDYSLYLVTDRNLSCGRSVVEIVKAAVRGGATVVQLREKECSTREYITLSKQILEFVKPLGVPLIINDRVDVALASGADGVHIGQNDMPYEEARRLMGKDAIVGLTVETVEEAISVENLDVDYLGVSAIFATPTKPDTKNEWGIEGLKTLRQKSKHKLVAIGGINPSNAEAVARAGADGLAVVSAICSAPDPEAVSRQLRTIIDKVKKEMMGI